MLFNSYAFLLLFLPAALASFAVLGRWLGPRGALTALAGASLFFYGWWSPPHLALLLGSIAANFLLGLAIAEARLRGSAAARRLFAAGVAANLAAIGWFKYAGFMAANLDALTGWNPGWSVVLPLGISFFTFQQIAYLASVLQSGKAEISLLRYVVFISFFAHLIAGPIVHPREILPQLARIRPWLRGWNLTMGFSLFALGLAKKVLLADPLALHADAGFARAAAGAVPDLVQAWGSLLSYTLQIYFDFSGYSDMAMGLALLFGLRFPVNFNSPYKATSIVEFWRRWHITLSQFLRDFVYIPLGGGRRGEARRYLNLIATMLIGGLWHGANWTFVLWGGLHGLYLAVNHLWRRGRPPSSRPSAPARLAGWAATFLAVMAAWVLFRADTLDTALVFYRGLAGLGGVALPGALMARLGGAGELLTGVGVAASGANPFAFLGMLAWVAVGLAFALAAPNSVELFRASALHAPGRAPRRLAWHSNRGWALALGILAGAALLELASPSTFIYFNF